MKLAVSNIAWPATLRDEAYARLRDRGVRGLEIAPGLFFAGAADPFAPTPQELDGALGPMRAAGLELVSMQSLLFGVNGASLFGSSEERGRLDSACLRAIALAGMLGIPTLVFGSPRQRIIPEDMNRRRAEALAVETFRRLGDAAAAAATRIAIEPNAAAYGTNFLNRIEEAADFVRLVDHPGIALNFDMGAVHAGGDFDHIEAIARSSADCTAHVHFSETELAPAPADVQQAAKALRALRQTGYQGWYSIEMAAASDPLSAVAGAIDRLLAAAADIQDEWNSHASA